MSNKEKAMAHLRVIYAYTAFARKRGTCFLGLQAICDIEERASDALALLEKQEAKCLTKAELDDLNENQFVWFEGRTGYLYCLQIIGICREKTGVSDIQFNAPTSYVERSTNTYGKTYRIWTDKPTEEQSQAVKWE